MIQEKSMSQTITEYIRAHPGCRRADILTVLGPNINPVSVSGTMGYLQRKRVIENRGGFGRNSSWYVIDNKALPMFLEMAADILQELKEMHPSVRTAHLAQRLEDLLGESLEEDAA